MFLGNTMLQFRKGLTEPSITILSVELPQGVFNIPVPIQGTAEQGAVALSGLGVLLHGAVEKGDRQRENGGVLQGFNRDTGRGVETKTAQGGMIALKREAVGGIPSIGTDGEAPEQAINQERKFLLQLSGAKEEGPSFEKRFLAGL